MARTNRPQNLDQLIAYLAGHPVSVDLAREFAQVRQLHDGPSASKAA